MKRLGMQGRVVAEMKEQITLSNTQPRQAYNNTAPNITGNIETQKQYLSSSSFNSKLQKGLTKGNYPIMHDALGIGIDYLTDDPSLLIARVPVGWPPTSQQVRH